MNKAMIKKILNQGCLIFLIGLTAISKTFADNKKVLLVGIDGVQFEHIHRLPTPNFDRLTITKAYAGGIKGRFNQQNTSSGPGWSTILTGVWVNKHGIKSNDTGPANRDWPSIFRLIHNANNDAELYSFSTWGTINTLYFPYDMPLLAARSEGGGDDKSLNLTLDVLRNSSPDFIFIHLDEPDGAGHSHGWGVEYDQSIIDSDRRLGMLLDEVEQREKVLNEEWLVLVTTDHGRNAITGNGHGSQTRSEKTVFIASNKELSQAYQQFASIPNQDFDGLYNTPAQTFIVPTILQYLGIGSDLLGYLDGFPLLGPIEPHQRMYATIGSARCGFEWDADAGTPVALERSEHIAKFDCGGNSDTLLVKGNFVYANIYGSSCGLQWNAKAGTPMTVDGNEHVAKFDCSQAGDAMTISSDFIYSTIDSHECGLEWDAQKGTPVTLTSEEHVAKFDCSGSADQFSFELIQ